VTALRAAAKAAGRISNITMTCPRGPGRAWARESRSDESASGPDGRLGHDVTCFDNGHCNGERGVVPSFTPRSETEYNIASGSITTESKQVANAMY